MKRSVFMLAAVLSCSMAFAQEEHGSKIVSTPQWEKLKTLVGEWDGYTSENDKKMPTHVSIRMTGDGSALMHWMAAGTKYEMVTMIHPDQSDLLATHYCAAHNQPRFKAVPSTKPDEIAFEFKDGTNIRPGDSFMRQLAFSFVDADHHNEVWGSDTKGKVTTVTFYMTRVKAQPKD